MSDSEFSIGLTTNAYLFSTVIKKRAYRVALTPIKKKALANNVSKRFLGF
ncbi:hypothetical protein [Thalassotalea maritima]